MKTIEKKYSPDYDIKDVQTIAKWVRRAPGCSITKNKLIKMYTPIIKKYSKYYQSAHCEWEDNFQEGMISLLKAIDNFDSHRSTHFTPYALFLIKKSIIEHTKKHNSLIKVSSYQRNKIKNNGDGEAGEFKNIHSFPMEKTISLNKYMYGEKNVELIDVLATPHNDFENIYIQDQIQYILNHCLQKLTLTEQFILKNRFLKSDKPLSLRRLAFLLDLSSERVRQIQNIALKKLKKSLL